MPTSWIGSFGPVAFIKWLAGDEFTAPWNRYNTGLVTENFTNEHPYWAAAINLAGDLALPLMFGGATGSPEGKQRLIRKTKAYKDARIGGTPLSEVEINGTKVKDIPEIKDVRGKVKTEGLEERLALINEPTADMADFVAMEPSAVTPDGFTYIPIPIKDGGPGFALLKENKN